MEGVPTVAMPKASFVSGYDLVSFLADTSILPSKSEAKKLLQAGGIAINKEKIAANKTTIQLSDLLQDKYILIQKGKKNYYLIITN